MRASPSLTVQKAIRSRLAADAGVVALVPAAAIADRHGLPASFPSIVLGEDVETPANLDLARRGTIVASTLHIWTREAGTAGAKAIVNAVRWALDVDLVLDSLDLVDQRVTGARFLRDPDGKTAHGILTFSTTVMEPLS
jgi:hypothetical protein